MIQKLKALMGFFHMPSTHEREMRYLNECSDRLDLEFRQRQVDRGMFRMSYNRNMISHWCVVAPGQAMR